VAHRFSQTTWLLLAVALVAGILIYQAFVVVLNGYIAAVAVPTEYFRWFGKPRQELALAILHVAGAIPVFLLVAGAILAVCRALRSRSNHSLMALLAGMLLCFIYWAVVFVAFLPADLPPEVKPFPVTVRIQQLFILPWWSLPTAVAPWLGFGLAAWLLRRRREA